MVYSVKIRKKENLYLIFKKHQKERAKKSPFCILFKF